jgi:indole-3-glycerol phosphate synthase
MSILDDIVRNKREEVASNKNKIAPSDLRNGEFFNRSPISLKTALQDTAPFGIIAEIKRSSPSAGTIKPTLRPDIIAAAYQQNGAAGISVLTDQKFFGGNIADVTNVRRAVTIPVLRKEFIIDEYQILESKSHGADAVLLIAAILERPQIAELFSAASEIGIECLVELYEPSELDRIDFDKMKLIGVNNRNLKTLEVDVSRSIEMLARLPKDVTVVSESGIHSVNDLRRLKEAGIHCALIGEYFMKSPDPGNTLREMLEQVTLQIQGN